MESIISVEEIAWAAGFFDGEGWIGIRNTKKETNYHCEIAIGQCEINPLLFFKEKFGGHVYLHKPARGNYRASYQWHAHGWVAIDFLSLVLKYLKVKKVKAEGAITFQNTFKRRGKPTKKTPEQDDFVKTFYLKTVA